MHFKAKFWQCSAVFLQRQKRIVNYYVKFRQRISVCNANKQWCFCCLQDKTWIKMPILWKHFSVTVILSQTFWRNIWRSVFDVVKILQCYDKYQWTFFLPTKEGHFWVKIKKIVSWIWILFHGFFLQRGHNFLDKNVPKRTVLGLTQVIRILANSLDRPIRLP